MTKNNEWVEAPMIPLFFEIRLSQAESLPNGSYVDPPHFGGVEQKLIIRPLLLLAGAKGFDVVEGIERYVNNDFNRKASSKEWSRGGHAATAISEFTLETYDCRGGELAMDWLMEAGDLVEVNGTVRYEMSGFRKFYENKLPTFLLTMTFLFALVSCALTTSAVFATNEGWSQVHYGAEISYKNGTTSGFWHCYGYAYFGIRHFYLDDTRGTCDALWHDCDYNEMESGNKLLSNRPVSLNALCIAMDVADWWLAVYFAFLSTILASFCSLGSLFAVVMHARTGRYAIPLLVLE